MLWRIEAWWTDGPDARLLTELNRATDVVTEYSGLMLAPELTSGIVDAHHGSTPHMVRPQGWTSTLVAKLNCVTEVFYECSRLTLAPDTISCVRDRDFPLAGARVQAALKCIEYLQPTYWFLENTVGHVCKRPFMQPRKQYLHESYARLDE